MPEFLPVLMVAVISLLVLFIMFSGEILFPSGSSGSPPESVEEIEIGSYFPVVYSEVEYIPVKFSGEVRHGLLENVQKCYDFKLERNISNGIISFSINDTNAYGELIFTLNRKVVYSGVKHAGSDSIYVNGSLFSDRNTFCIGAGSSGFMFWAPTVYILDTNLTLVEVNSKYTKEFGVHKTPSRAELYVSIVGYRGDGNIEIKINGNRIYYGHETEIHKDIDPLNLHDKNIIEFTADPGTSWLIGTAKISVS
jgi:hypothetical protein